MANQSPRRAFTLALAAFALLVLPVPAQASLAKVDAAGKLIYTALPGEANALTLSAAAPGTVMLTDTGHLGPFPIVIAGTGNCHGLAQTITCTGVSSAEIKVGDGNDSVNARDGVAETISCGSGSDTVIADPQDSVGADCESVDWGQLAGQGPAPAPHGPATDPVAPAVGHSAALDDPSPFVNVAPPVILAQTASVNPAGVARVRIACPVAAIECRGTVALVQAAPAPKRRARVVAAAAASAHRSITLGSARFDVLGGQKPFVQVRLNRRGRQRILRSRHRRCRMVVTTRASTGSLVTTSRMIDLRARGRKR